MVLVESMDGPVCQVSLRESFVRPGISISPEP